MEYLVRWRGYGYEGDTWEPETHLANCMEFIHEFNRQLSERQRDGSLIRSTRSSPYITFNHSSSSGSNNARKQISRPPPHGPNVSQSTAKMISSPTPPVLAISPTKQQQQHLLDLKDSTFGMQQYQQRPPQQQQQQQMANQKYRRSGAVTDGVAGSGLTVSPAVNTVRRSMDLAKSGIKILVPKSPMNSRTDSEESPSEAAQGLEQGGQEPDSVPPEVALLEKPAGIQLGPGEERARMGTRPRTQTTLAPPQLPITPAAMRILNGKGEVLRLGPKKVYIECRKIKSPDKKHRISLLLALGELAYCACLYFQRYFHLHRDLGS